MNVGPAEQAANRSLLVGTRKTALLAVLATLSIDKSGGATQAYFPKRSYVYLVPLAEARSLRRDS